MKAALKTLFVLALVLSCVAMALAQDKEITLKGKVTCAKCDLKVAGQTACATVIVVKEKDKDIVYYFDEDSHKKNHRLVCTESKEGTVVGKVAEKDGKKIITATKVEIK
jgi:hypothetical protein